MSTKFIKNQSDWTCPDEKCANVNFARRDSCNRCGKSKPIEKSKKIGREIGKNLAEKSKGLFSADDWQCTQCGNVNWARRSTCNICNAPKFGKVEQRTGFGGGYNERENIEYIERDDSDGEYDEFGRKKKKYRETIDGDDDSEADEKERGHGDKFVQEKKIKQDSPLPKSVVEPIEIGEEESDGDDEDLSKYDLIASDDEQESKGDDVQQALITSTDVSKKGSSLANGHPLDSADDATSSSSSDDDDEETSEDSSEASFGGGGGAEGDDQGEEESSTSSEDSGSSEDSDDEDSTAGANGSSPTLPTTKRPIVGSPPEAVKKLRNSDGNHQSPKSSSEVSDGGEEA